MASSLPQYSLETLRNQTPIQMQTRVGDDESLSHEQEAVTAPEMGQDHHETNEVHGNLNIGYRQNHHGLQREKVLRINRNRP